MAVATIPQNLLSVQARFLPILAVFGRNDLESQGQRSPYAIPSENYPKWIKMPNLEALATMLQKLSSVQARFWPILAVFGPNDIEGQGQMSLYASHLRTIQDASKCQIWRP